MDFLLFLILRLSGRRLAEAFFWSDGINVKSTLKRNVNKSNNLGEFN